MMFKKSIMRTFLAMLSAAALATAGVISYSDFSDLSSFQLNGATASIHSSGPVSNGTQDVLRLTNSLGQGGSAFLTNSIKLEDGSGFQASFSAYFQFQITHPIGISDQDGQGADGLVFVVQTNSANVGGSGGGIGYAGISKSVGIEFDSWANSADGWNPNHVGIDINGSVTSVVKRSVSPRLNDGNIWSAWVDYNGDSDLLEVRLNQTGIRPTDAYLSRNIDLVSVLQTPDAYIGFTSGTGAAGGYHDILNMQFIDTYKPIDNSVPEPTSVLLIGMGLLGIGFLRRKK